MAEIILDLGSGNTCKNNLAIAIKMIDEIIKIDTKKHKIIYKWQLFQKAGDNIPLKYEIFKLAYNYAQEKGYQTTASVFDTYSLETLMWLEVPFIKIPCRCSLYWLIGEIPRRYKIYVSCYKDFLNILSGSSGIKMMACVPQYPAKIKEYDKITDMIFGWVDFADIQYNISDHTIGLDLFKKYEKKIGVYECHFCLDDSKGLDAGPWCKRITELKEIL